MNNERRDELLLEIHSAVHSISGIVDRHDKTLYGNGQPGVCSRLKEVEMRGVINSKWAVVLVTSLSAIMGGGITVAISALVTKFIS